MQGWRMLFEAYDPVSKLEAALYLYRIGFDVLPMPARLNFSHKWIAASVLQKSIRRGNVSMAYKAGLSMMQINPNSVWNRLRVIACEDIGIGDMRVVYETLYVSGKVKWRERHGGHNHVLAYIIEMLCKADKSRLADDILYTADVHADYHHQRMAYVDCSHDQLYDIILYQSDRNIFERMIALCYLHGTTIMRPQGMVEMKGQQHLVLDIFKQSGMPYCMLEVVKLALPRTEGHALSLGLALMMQASALNHHIIKDDFKTVTIGEWPAEAYDKHTREGKQAFKRFLYQCPNVLLFIQGRLPKVDPVTMVGWCVFALEAQILDKRVTFDGSEDIRTKAQSAWLQCDGMTPQAQHELLKLMQSHMGTLNECRG
jgi:hypothetical protein